MNAPPSLRPAFVVAGILAAVACAFSGCSSRSGSDSETHFLCARDSECREHGYGDYCVADHCRHTPATAGAETTSVPAPPMKDAGTFRTMPTMPIADGAFVPMPRPSDAATDALTTCGTVSQSTEAIATEALIVMDRSSSANGFFPNSMVRFFDVAATGIDAFASSVAGAAMGLGVQYYPPQGDGGGDCSAVEPIAVGVAVGNAAKLSVSIGAQRPAGDPTARGTYAQALATMKARAKPATGSAVVLVMSALPLECDPMAQPDLAGLAQTAHDGTPSVSTYVIGVGDGDLSALTPIAVAGGTKRAYFATTLNGAQDVIRGLRAASPFGVPCQFEFMGSVAGRKIDPKLVNIVYRDSMGAMNVVPATPDAASCALNNEVGWYYDDPLNPTTIVVCQASCDAYQGDQVSILYGCTISGEIR